MGRPLGTVDEIIADVLGNDLGYIKLPRAFLEEVGRDILLSLQSDGLVVVPLEPSLDMLDAADNLGPSARLPDTWRAMILANPHRLGSDEYWDNLLKMHSDEPKEEQQ